MVVAPRFGVRAKHSSPAVVLQWNEVLQDTLAAPGNPLTPRFYAMMHIAMFDAINAIEREFEPYRVRLSTEGGSPDAAAAQAAHDVLVVLNRSAAATYDATLAANLGDRPSRFVRRGAEVGARVAKEILAWRENDGWVGLAVSALLRATPPGTVAANPPGERRRHLHASPARAADGSVLGDAVSADASAVAHERAVRCRPE